MPRARAARAAVGLTQKPGRRGAGRGIAAAGDWGDVQVDGRPAAARRVAGMAGKARQGVLEAAERARKASARAFDAAERATRVLEQVTAAAIFVRRMLLRRRTALAVAEPVDGELLQPRRIYLAPRDMHMVVEDGRVRVNRGPKEHHTRPAVDPLFSSAAAAHGPRVVGVLLSGAGDDGLRGLIAIKAAGGISIVQDPAEALHPPMPRNAIVYHRADSVLPVARIGATLTALANGGPVEVEASPAGPRPSFTLDRGA